jgi:hypothetical protein
MLLIVLYTIQDVIHESRVLKIPSPPRRPLEGLISKSAPNFGELCIKNI